MIQLLEEPIARLGPFTVALHGGAAAVQLLERVLAGQEPDLLERRAVAYKCYCSRERVTRAIIRMGKEEMQNIIEEQGGEELTCQFCDKVYRFTKEDLQELLEEATR